MKVYNIYQNNEPGLGSHSDDRGQIHDVFYKHNMNHGCIITNEPNAVRGNHYHKFTTQYTFVVEGELTYYSQPVDQSKAVDMYQAKKGDFIISEPNEVHTLKSGPNGCVFIAFTEGPRGGEDYESDTYRVDSIVS
jgi:quercetin dioxygenase-like cupin family protein